MHRGDWTGDASGLGRSQVGATGLRRNNSWVSLVTGLRFVNDSNGPWTLLAAGLHNETQGQGFQRTEGRQQTDSRVPQRAKRVGLYVRTLYGETKARHLLR